MTAHDGLGISNLGGESRLSKFSEPNAEPPDSRKYCEVAITSVSLAWYPEAGQRRYCGSSPITSCTVTGFLLKAHLDLLTDSSPDQADGAECHEPK
jgi:hypothetical protein